VSVPLVSDAVMVRVPAVLKVRLDKVRVPETSVRFPAVAPLSSAMVALLSELLRLTLAPAPATRFQFASTARTMMPLAIGVSAVCAVGEPVLPVAVPGAAVSPGNKICSLVTAAALMEMTGLVSDTIEGLVTSESVTVWLPAVLKVTLKERLPFTSAALDGGVEFGSDKETAIRSFVLTRFQKLSTALAVTLKAVPAV